MEINSNDGHAVVGLRFDVLNIVDGGGHGALENRDHALFHLLGGNAVVGPDDANHGDIDRKSTRLNSSHLVISYAVFCLKKKTKNSISTSASSESQTTPEGPS